MDSLVLRHPIICKEFNGPPCYSVCTMPCLTGVRSLNYTACSEAQVKTGLVFMEKIGLQ
jgi:hypothetical protein